MMGSIDFGKRMESIASVLTPDRVRRWSLTLMAAYAISVGVILAQTEGLIDRRNGAPIGMDFMAFWSASWVALGGVPAAVYDLRAIGAAHELVVSGFSGLYPWLHPPTFLAVVWPLALLTYPVALVTWNAATLAACAVPLRRLAGQPEAWFALGAFPGVWINGWHGQIGFLTTALFALALLSLRRRPALAGMMFGLLAIKPHLGLLIPVALAAGRQWRAFMAAAATVLAFVAATALLFGPETWAAFLDRVPRTRVVWEDQPHMWLMVPSLFAGLRGAGMTAGAAYAAQSAAALAAVLAVAALWRRDPHAPATGAALVAGTLVALPYVGDYDLMLLAVPIALLARDGLERGWLPGERATLAAAFFAAPAAIAVQMPVLSPLAAWLAMTALLAAAARRASVDLMRWPAAVGA